MIGKYFLMLNFITSLMLLTFLLFFGTDNLFSTGKHVSGSNTFIPVNESMLNLNSENPAIQINIKKDKELTEVLKDKYALEKTVTQDSVLAEINGFRVQIYTTDDLDRAKAKIVIYNELFQPENVKLDFDPPYFKIRVGNLRDKDEAEKFKEKLADMGFRNLMIIRSKVIVKIPKK